MRGQGLEHDNDNIQSGLEKSLGIIIEKVSYTGEQDWKGAVTQGINRLDIPHPTPMFNIQYLLISVPS